SLAFNNPVVGVVGLVVVDPDRSGDDLRNLLESERGKRCRLNGWFYGRLVPLVRYSFGCPRVVALVCGAVDIIRDVSGQVPAAFGSGRHEESRPVAGGDQAGEMCRGCSHT